MNPTAVRGVLLSSLLKLLCKQVEKRFGTQDPSRYQFTNASTMVAGNDSSVVCQFNNSIHSDNPMSAVTSWIYTSRYLLPMLGGLLSSIWLGYVRVMQIGGAVMLLSTVLMTLAVNLGFMCQHSSPIIPIAWLLLLLFFALIQPNVQYGMFRWHKHGKACTVVSALYIGISALGEWTAGITSDISELGNHLSGLFIAVSAAFIALSLFLPQESDEPFQMPTKQRMQWYFRIFSGLILFLICVSDMRRTVYISELQLYLNATSLESHYWMSPDCLKYLCLIVFIPIFVIITVISPRELPLQARMQAGILLEAAVTLSLIIFSRFGAWSSATAIAVYAVASVLDGIAEALVMVAAYDTGNRISPSNTKAFILGVMFAVWGISNIVSRLLISAVDKTHFLIYHIIILVCLVACSIYQKWLAFPLAIQLIPSQDDGEDVLQPLLTPNED